MAILAGALLPLLALQGQFVTTTQTLERSERRLATHNLAIAHISALNLDQSPAGRLQTRYGEISWQAVPSAGPHPGRGASGFPSRYVVTLYTVNIEIDYSSSQAETLSLQGLGWHPTASIFDTL